VTRIVGKHEFRRRDVGQTVAEAILAGWPGRWRQVDEDADIEVWVNLLGNELLCGVRLSDASMRHRGRTGAQSAGWQHRPAALRPALAAAMVMLTEPAPGDIFLDPMAGSGTLPIERAAAGPFQQLYASDRDSAAYAALQANTRHIDGNVQCERWDARRLPLPDHGIDKVAVNLPFGKQVAAEMDLARLYRDVLHELQRVIRPGGRLVVLVGDMRLFDAAYKDSAPAWHPGARHRVEALGQPATIRVLVKAEA
jgi:23S rRNA G2445 N2-methylase RlmL